MDRPQTLALAGPADSRMEPGTFPFAASPGQALREGLAVGKCGHRPTRLQQGKAIAVGGSVDHAGVGVGELDLFPARREGVRLGSVHDKLPANPPGPGEPFLEATDELGRG